MGTTRENGARTVGRGCDPVGTGFSTEGIVKGRGLTHTKGMVDGKGLEGRAILSRGRKVGPELGFLWSGVSTTLSCSPPSPQPFFLL